MPRVTHSCAMCATRRPTRDMMMLRSDGRSLWVCRPTLDHQWFTEEQMTCFRLATDRGLRYSLATEQPK